MIASWKKHILNFHVTRGTSRGTLNTKPSWFIFIHDRSQKLCAIGECGLLPKLSVDDRKGYEAMLDTVVGSLNKGTALPDLVAWPSIRFAVEQLHKQLENQSFAHFFDTPFAQGAKGIKINGLIWMDRQEIMLREIEEKLDAGFACLKLKIGAIDFDKELKMLAQIRKRFSPSEIELRVDANGAFTSSEAPDKLERLHAFELHSIEQPIRAGQWDAMADLCRKSPFPIALDEELIGVHTFAKKEALMATIRPQAIILKPSLLGGFVACDEWIALAEKYGAIWWATSALESNIGLNAIAQYAASKKPVLPQGLGTGQLYSNNIEGPLEVDGDQIYFRAERKWQLPHWL